MQSGYFKILRAEISDARPSAVRERKASKERKIYFGPRGDELVVLSGGEGFADDVLSVQRSNILPFSLPIDEVWVE